MTTSRAFFQSLASVMRGIKKQSHISQMYFSLRSVCHPNFAYFRLFFYPSMSVRKLFFMYVCVCSYVCSQAWRQWQSVLPQLLPYSLKKKFSEAGRPQASKASHYIEQQLAQFLKKVEGDAEECIFLFPKPYIALVFFSSFPPPAKLKLSWTSYL